MTEQREDPHAFLFGYGSLMSPASINRTVAEPIDPSEVRPAELRGYLREWGYWDWVRFEGAGDEQVPAVFMNIVERADRSCNGTIFRVSEEDLARMDLRERHYDRIDVTPLITPATGGVVYTYVARSGHDAPPDDACVSTRYHAIIESALEHWGPSFARRYHESTQEHRFAFREGVYRYVQAENEESAPR